MENILNVLYQSDDNYAPQTGISMLSLFENNRSLSEINVYVLNDNISDTNLARMKELCDQYGRNLFVIDTASILQTLKDLNVQPFRGTYTTYFKLLAINAIKTPNDRILQLDGDTIINESLEELFDIDLTGYVCAATYECVQNSYKNMIGLEPSEAYYNCGVLWINQAFWREYDCEAKIIKHLSTVRSRYFTVDQDIINVLFRDKITYLDIKFNLNSGFYTYGVEGSYYIYDLDPSYYARPEEIKQALSKPFINHCMTPMTGRPWEQDNLHPQNALYDHYLMMSPWKNTPKIVVNRTGMFKTQRNLYLHIPQALYCRIHKIVLKRYLRKMNQECLN